MRMANVVVLVTCASRKEAERLARAVVERKLAACVNVAAPVRSVYRWKGKVETAAEFPMVIKTTRGKFAALEKEIRRLHSYETPEIIALPIVAGSADYLRWIAESLKA